LGYKQTKPASSEAASGKGLEKSFRIEVGLETSQIYKLLQIYSMIRNIGSGNPDRNLKNVNALSIDFNTPIVSSCNPAHQIAEQWRPESRV
jgi:hypothetical protein